MEKYEQMKWNDEQLIPSYPNFNITFELVDECYEYRNWHFCEIHKVLFNGEFVGYRCYDKYGTFYYTVHLECCEEYDVDRFGHWGEGFVYVDSIYNFICVYNLILRENKHYDNMTQVIKEATALGII